MKDAFQALSDPTRRAILDLLRKRSHTSGEIADHFGSSWPTISRHLGILKDAGLIRVERDGQFMRYELHTTVFQDVAEQVAAWLNTSPNKKNA